MAVGQLASIAGETQTRTVRLLLCFAPRPPARTRGGAHQHAQPRRRPRSVYSRLFAGGVPWSLTTLGWSRPTIRSPSCMNLRTCTRARGGRQTAQGVSKRHGGARRQRCAHAARVSGCPKGSKHRGGERARPWTWAQTRPLLYPAGVPGAGCAGRAGHAGRADGPPTARSARCGRTTVPTHPMIWQGTPR